MSWSMSAVGYPAAVMENLKVALGAFPDTYAVRVEASGSQSPSPDGKFVNSLQVKVEPLWGFVTE